MSALAEDLDRELNGLDREAARRLEHLVRELLYLLKGAGSGNARPPLVERLKNHPAIGSWPTNLDADVHIAAVRAEWEGCE